MIKYWPGYRIAGRALAVCIALSLAANAGAQDINPDPAARYADREAIEAVLERYVIGLDRLDADLYASAFAEDGEIVIYEETTHRGHEALRTYIAEVVAAMEALEAVGDGRLMFHMHYNQRIFFTGADTAEHHAYWTTTARMADGRIDDIGVGTLRDTFVRRDGEWKLLRRELFRDP